MTYNFELLERGKYHQRAEFATIRLNPGGEALYLSAGVIERYFRGFPYCKVFYDPKARVIAVEPLKGPADHASKISSKRSEANASIATGRLFSKYPELDPRQFGARRLAVEWSPEHGKLLIFIDHEVGWGMRS